MDINRVVLIGRLTRDPELKYLANENAVCEFSLALNYRRKINEEWTEQVDFFDVVVYGNHAEACAEYLAKGKLAGVEGRLKQDRWETDGGEKRSRVRVQATSVQFIGGRDGDSAEASAPEEQFEPAGSFGDPGDDDIPF